MPQPPALTDEQRAKLRRMAKLATDLADLFDRQDPDTRQAWEAQTGGAVAPLVRLLRAGAANAARRLEADPPPITGS